MNDTRPKYRPKFCRTRRCTEKFEHDGPHTGPSAERVPFHGRTPDRGRVTVFYRPLPKSKAAPVVGAAANMDRIRKHRNVQNGPTAKQRRAARALAKLGVSV